MPKTKNHVSKKGRSKRSSHGPACAETHTVLRESHRTDFITSRQSVLQPSRLDLPDSLPKVFRGDVGRWDAPDQARTNRRLVEHLSNAFDLQKLYASTNVRKLGDSIQSHTTAVMDEFFKRYEAYGLDRIERPAGIRSLAGTMRVTLALHDIGKPVQGREHQHKNTLDILDRVLPELKLSAEEQALSKSLIANDVLGEFVQRSVEPKRVFVRLEQLAAQNRMSPKDYVQLNKAFYLADATYYPHIRSKFSDWKKSAHPVPTKPKAYQNWAALEALSQAPRATAPSGDRGASHRRKGKKQKNR